MCPPRASALLRNKSSSGTSVSTTRVELRATLDKYCVSCHNDRLKTANLTLQSGDVDLVGAHSDVWEKVARKLRTHEMPPPGRPRPDAATYSALASQLETALDKASAASPNPGRVAVHRLNRVEYTNAVRDLLGLEVDGRALLPDDSNQESFRQHRQRPLCFTSTARTISVGRLAGQSSCGWRAQRGLR